ncbi:MAG: hypothetical protein GY820_14690, partial [Gammaproteobacteria bacterium]|nr:hypothetical protein [Gammaproteobacteria bacterium]
MTRDNRHFREVHQTERKLDHPSPSNFAVTLRAESALYLSTQYTERVMEQGNGKVQCHYRQGWSVEQVIGHRECLSAVLNYPPQS